MAGIYIIDTSVLLNILDVPGRNQDRDAVFAAFEARIKAGSRFRSTRGSSPGTAGSPHPV